MSQSILQKRWPWLLGAAVIVVSFLSTIVEVEIGPVGDPRPIGTVDDIAALRDRDDLNVLFVLIDTLRADRLGTYGYERDTSPTIDRLVATGVRFDRHLAQSSWTKASMASMWTGLNPTRTGVTRFDDIISDEARMPAEVLKEAGFQTVGVYRNGWVAATFGFDQGFDVYTRPVSQPVPPSVRNENPTLSSRGTDHDLVTTAEEFLRINGDARWFMYLHLMDIHEYLYDEQTAIFGATYSDIYDNSIRWTDGAIDALVARLAEGGYADNTLVVIASDHGEAFQERGHEGHARQVYRESTEVPLLILFPFQLESGIVVPTRTRNVDIWPTVLDLLGLESPTGIDGRSRLPDILAAAASGQGADAGAPAPAGISHLDQHWGQRNRKPNPTVAVTEGKLRYVRVNRPRGGPAEFLFDADKDPAELEDRAAEQRENVERLRKIANDYMAMSPPWGEAPKREIDELELNQLRALGYAIP